MERTVVRRVLRCSTVVLLLMAPAHAMAARCVPVVEPFPGFPIQLPNVGGVLWSNAVTSANVADLDGDGMREIVFGRADNTLYAFDWTGNDLPGFPISFGGVPGWGISGEPLLYDLDAKGGREIVFATNGLPPGNNTTYLHVYKHTGVAHPLWPVGGVDIGTNSMYTPVGADLERAGRRQVLIDSSRIGFGYYLNGFGSNGNPAFGFPVAIGPNGGLSSPSVADATVNAGSEVFFGGVVQTMYATDKYGNMLAGWPAVAHASRTPALGDVDGDGDVDVVAVMPCVVGTPAAVVVYDANGAVLPGWPQYDKEASSFIFSSPSLADLDGDGRLEVIVHIYEPSTPVGGSIHVWRADGTPMPGWPRPMERYTGGETNVTVADVDHDGRLELVAIASPDAQPAKLYVFNANGTPQFGFPHVLPAGSHSRASPALADINGDGKLEIVFTWQKNEPVAVLSYAQLEVLQIRDCTQTGRPDATAWPQFKHDPRHSGFLGK